MQFLKIRAISKFGQLLFQIVLHYIFNYEHFLFIINILHNIFWIL